MNFTEFQLDDHLLQAINQCGFSAPTPIQQQAIPAILAGRDVLGLAQTGTGKTAAFILPVVQHLMKTPCKHPRVLVVAPTRELVEQITDFTREIIHQTQLRTLALYGGVGKSAQAAALRQGVDIIVACPGRLLDLQNDKAIDLFQVEALILDEADHMFDKGFLPDIRKILRLLPIKRQNLVFSATMPDAITHLAESILVNPVTVRIHPSRPVRSIAHRVFTVDQGQKTNLLVHLLNEELMAATLVFTRTKHKAKHLTQKLIQSGFKATSLQGNLSQNKRQQALNDFKNGTSNILVATDIAARGIDVTGISHVINYDMPDTAEAYIHRTGRTGRATRSGEALTFATDEDKRMLHLIERSLDNPMSRQIMPKLPDSQPPVLQQRKSSLVQPAASPRRGPQGTNKPVPATSKQRPRSSNSGIFGLSGRGK